jgi:hypothetical protein
MLTTEFSRWHGNAASHRLPVTAQACHPVLMAHRRMRDPQFKQQQIDDLRAPTSPL